MITQTQFQKKVQSMSAKELIMAMVEGLQNHTTVIKMSTYGKVANAVCFGCAATNAICNIAQINKKEFIKLNPQLTMMDIYGDKVKDFMCNLETAYNSLRRGDIKELNHFAYKINIDEITNHKNLILPVLNNDYTQADLDIYIQLADSQ